MKLTLLYFSPFGDHLKAISQILLVIIFICGTLVYYFGANYCKCGYFIDDLSMANMTNGNFYPILEIIFVIFSISNFYLIVTSQDLSYSLKDIHRFRKRKYLETHSEEPRKARSNFCICNTQTTGQGKNLDPQQSRTANITFFNYYSSL